MDGNTIEFTSFVPIFTMELYTHHCGKIESQVEIFNDRLTEIFNVRVAGRNLQW